jgi:hypothetical protein
MASGLKLTMFGLLSLIFVGTPYATQAQDNAPDEVIVTGMRISSDSRVVQPHVSRRVKADFVWVEVNCQSGSVNQTERTRELTQTYQNLVSKVASTVGLKLSGGEIDDARIPIETIRYSEIAVRAGPVDRFGLILSLDTRSGESFEAIVTRAGEFARTFGTFGRAECQIGSNQKIGLRNVQGNRDLLLDAIAADVTSLQRRFSGREVEVSGLEARVVAIPATAFEMDLFIPYKVTVHAARTP